ncbi:MAG: outer membrane lipoprotein-sorting protein [bacterium]
MSARRWLVLAAFLVTLAAGLFAQEPDSEALARLRRADANWTYLENDFSAEYRIVQDTPGEGRSVTVAALFRRDRDDIYTIIILEPEIDRGQGYLKQGNTLWLYDPESGRFNTTSSRERFQNSNARNSDFTQSTLAQDYDILSVEPTQLGRFGAFVYELESDEEGVTYPYMRVWITDDGRILKTEDYSRSRRLLRVTAVPSYRNVGSKAIPEQIYIIDMLEGAQIDGEFVHERTNITVSSPSFDPVPDTVFTKAFLERMGR